MNWSEVFEYKDGVLIWRIKPCKNQKPGMVAGCVNKNGYRYISFLGKKYKASHIVWLIFNPQDVISRSQQIDHINHVRSDDRIGNLRKTTNKGNSRNRQLRSSSKSGAMGVYWREDVSKWRATIKVDGVNISLGFFCRLEEAIAARTAAEVRYGFHDNHGK